MSKQREAMKQALHALQTKGEHHRFVYDAMKALAEALAEPEQEPLTDGELYAAFLIGLNSKKPVRKPLTDAEIADLWDGHVVPVFGKNGINPIVFARAIEAKLKEKNNK